MNVSIVRDVPLWRIVWNINIIWNALLLREFRNDERFALTILLSYTDPLIAADNLLVYCVNKRVLSLQYKERKKKKKFRYYGVTNYFLIPLFLCSSSVFLCFYGWLFFIGNGAILIRCWDRASMAIWCEMVGVFANNWVSAWRSFRGLELLTRLISFRIYLIWNLISSAQLKEASNELWNLSWQRIKNIVGEIVDIWKFQIAVPNFISFH